MTLRSGLRAASERDHAQLDALMGPLALGSDYAGFLGAQYRARRPVEAWLANHAPEGWEPPVQTPLIARDLAVLGSSLPEPHESFEVSVAGFRGVAWAIAGSSLGNRALLTRRRKAGQIGSDSFLADEGMTAYWQRLRPVLEERADAADLAACSVAARAVFALFARCAGFRPLEAAA